MLFNFNILDVPTLLSTITGGLIVLWASEYSKKGKISLFVTGKRFYVVEPTDTGGEKEISFVNARKGTGKSHFYFSIECYNSSADLKIARNIQLHLFYNHKSIQINPHNNFETIKSINFEPKKLQSLEFFGKIDDKIDLEKIAKIYIVFEDEKRRIRKKLLHAPNRG